MTPRRSSAWRPTLALDGWAPTISADALFENLNDGDTSNDPVVVSVRAADDYALGHIAGAINIPWNQIANPENLAKLPTDKPIVVYCYTGHTGQVAATVLKHAGLRRRQPQVRHDGLDRG